MKIILPKSKVLVTFLFFAVFLFGNVAFGQATGDYRSLASGNWNDYTKWEYYNGSGWVTSSNISPQGYPGKYAPTGAVLIQAGHTISIGTSGITTVTMGTVTISGTLKLTGDNNSVSVFDIKTSKLVVTPGLSPAATISFQDKASLVLPANAELQVSTGGLTTIGNCDANQEIMIGGSKISACTTGTKFSDTMSAGGYNNSCLTFSLTGVSATQACEVGKQSTVSLTSNSAGLPVGNYTVEYRLSSNGYSTVYTAPMTVVTAGSGSFTANLAILSRDQSTSIRIDKLTAGSCTSNISSNNVSNSFFIARSNNPPVAAGSESCNNWIAQWSNDLINASPGDGYYLDVAKDINFTIFVSGYQNLFVGNVYSYTLTGLARGGTYHYRVRSKNYCGTTGNSNVISFTEDGNGSSTPGTISGGATTVCVGSNTPAFINTGSNPSPGVWSIYPISGDATITSAGVVTGTSPGTVNVVYSVGSGCVSSVIQQLTIGGGTIGTASSSPTPCINTVMTSITHTVIGFTGIGTVTNLPTGVTPSLSGNTLTISGTPTASGTFNYSIQLTGSSCGTGIAYATGTITVNPNLGNISLNGVSYPSNGSAIYCPSTTATFSIAPVSGATSYTWFVPTGWKTEGGVAITAPITSSSNELKVITGTNAESGSVTVTIDAFCPSNLGVTLSTIPPTAPTASATAQPTCAVPTGTIKVTSPAAGTKYTVTGTNPVVAAVTNTDGVFPNLTAGDYAVTSQIGSGCVSISTAVSLQALATKTWDGSSWLPAGNPTINDYVIFNGVYTGSLGSVNACSCTVNSTAAVTIASGKVLIIENGLTVQAGGTLLFEDKASLIQKDKNATNLGDITYRRTATPIKDFDYVYWSSPVAPGQKLGALSPLSDKYWSFANDNWAKETINSTMITGKGYIVRVPRYVTSQTVNFFGKPNNGDVSIATQGVNKGNLIGNPYPSAIDAKKFMEDNVSLLTDTGAMLYFWTHITARKINAGGTALVYESDDYSYFNLTGVVGAEPGRPIPDGTIAAGQSFMVASKIGGFFKFTNSMRISAENKNGQFFKQTNTKKTAKDEKNRIWLNLSNAGGAFKQMLVGYVTGATNDMDKLYDGASLNGNAYVDFYSVMNSKKYTIQGRGLPFDETDEVPLGYKSTIAGTFQIGIDNVDGSMVNQAIYLEDKITNTIHDLKTGAYSFATAIGEFNDRFVLRYTNTSKLGTGDVVTKGKGFFVSVRNREIKINSFDQAMSKVMVYDLKGSLLYEKNKVNKNEFIIDTLMAGNQFMIVMVQLEDGKWISEEIIFHD